MDNYKDWIGKKISRSDIITPRLVDHLKNTIDQNCLSNQSVPEGIFLCLCPDVASINDLDNDGNTKLGIFLPELPYKIRMWAGGKIKIFDKFEIGSEIKKNSTISSIDFKEGRSGNLCFVNINHEYLDVNIEFVYSIFDNDVEAQDEPFLSSNVLYQFILRKKIAELIFPVNSLHPIEKISICNMLFLS